MINVFAPNSPLRHRKKVVPILKRLSGLTGEVKVLCEDPFTVDMRLGERNWRITLGTKLGEERLQEAADAYAQDLGLTPTPYFNQTLWEVANQLERVLFNTEMFIWQQNPLRDVTTLRFYSSADALRHLRSWTTDTSVHNLPDGSIEGVTEDGLHFKIKSVKTE